MCLHGYFFSNLNTKIGSKAIIREICEAAQIYKEQLSNKKYLYIFEGVKMSLVSTAEKEIVLKKYAVSATEKIYI